MITVIENQTLLDIAVINNGSVMAAFDYAITNGISITDQLTPGQIIYAVEPKEYNTNEFVEIAEKYIDKRKRVISVIENQSLLDVAIQEDGCVLAGLEWAIYNGLSITDLITPGQKLNMPKSTEFRYEDLANYFNEKSQLIATYKPTVEAPAPSLLNYYLPGVLPYSL